jgi:hypothetical protein
MREEAVRFFDIAARLYLEGELEAAKKAIFEDTIIKEVKAAGGLLAATCYAVNNGDCRSGSDRSHSCGRSAL